MINKNYAFEISGLHKIRNFRDGVTVIDPYISLDLYKGDHNPKFTILLIFMNFKLIEIGVYNIHHQTTDKEIL
jgi:hypothetical protein